MLNEVCGRTSGTGARVVGLVGGGVGLLTLFVFQLLSTDEGEVAISFFELRRLNSFLESLDMLPLRDFFPLFCTSPSAMGEDSRLLSPEEVGGVMEPEGGVSSMGVPSAGSALMKSS